MTFFLFSIISHYFANAVLSLLLFRPCFLPLLSLTLFLHLSRYSTYYLSLSFLYFLHPSIFFCLCLPLLILVPHTTSLKPDFSLFIPSFPSIISFYRFLYFSYTTLLPSYSFYLSFLQSLLSFPSFILLFSSIFVSAPQTTSLLYFLHHFILFHPFLPSSPIIPHHSFLTHCFYPFSFFSPLVLFRSSTGLYSLYYFRSFFSPVYLFLLQFFSLSFLHPSNFYYPSLCACNIPSSFIYLLRLSIFCYPFLPFHSLFRIPLLSNLASLPFPFLYSILSSFTVLSTPHLTYFSFLVTSIYLSSISVSHFLTSSLLILFVMGMKQHRQQH